MCPFLVPLNEHVEEKWLHIKVECLVLQEQLGHEAEVLAVHLVLFPVNFEEGQAPMSVNLVARGMAPAADFLCVGE